LHRDAFHDGIHEFGISLLQFLSGAAMKKRVFMFVWVALLALAVVPVINLNMGDGQKKNAELEWWRDPALYNLDFASVLLSRFFYPHGISTNPDQVLIGKEDWLYLGEQYGNTISRNRRGATVEDAEVARIIGHATNSWSEWLSLKGVSTFRVMLGPDKGTIYPEFLPDWAQPAAQSATDTLLANVSQGLYIDTRTALRAAKSQFSESLYYKTDTHWNSLGAWVAFRAFQREIARTEGGLRWLTEQDVRITNVNERQGGDLAKFLRLKEILRDDEVAIDIMSELPVETEQYDFETGRLKRSGGNPEIHSAQRPLLVKSKNALNQKRVLWLRDSFGTAIAPFMAATFSETLQLHYDAAHPELFARLVDIYKPDYVFITVVERGAGRTRFGSLPPLIFSSGQPENSRPLSSGVSF
jgi:alginate O-acetyltransferase complex protein AlgJ